MVFFSAAAKAKLSAMELKSRLGTKDLHGLEVEKFLKRPICNYNWRIVGKLFCETGQKMRP